MRCFDFNHAFKVFGGTYAASTNTALAVYCFDELEYTNWVSTGENNDSTISWVERNFGGNRTFNRIFIKDTNIIAPYFKYYNGASWIQPTQTLISDIGTDNHLIELAVDLTTDLIRVYGGATIVGDAEKTVEGIYTFEELGALNIPPAMIQPYRVKEQSKHVLDNAKKMYINRGKAWEITLTFKAHVGQADVTLIETMVTRDMEFYIWINDNGNSYMNQKFAPYRFTDVIKVSVDKGDNPEYYNNLFFSGMNDKIKLVEVV